MCRPAVPSLLLLCKVTLPDQACDIAGILFLPKWLAEDDVAMIGAIQCD